MGIDDTFAKAYAKAQIAANQRLPLGGSIFISVNDVTKATIVPVAQEFVKLGFKVTATGGTAAVLENAGVSVTKVLKLHEGRPHAGKFH